MKKSPDAPVRLMQISAPISPPLSDVQHNPYRDIGVGRPPPGRGKKTSDRRPRQEQHEVSGSSWLVSSHVVVASSLSRKCAPGRIDAGCVGWAQVSVVFLGHPGDYRPTPSAMTQRSKMSRIDRSILVWTDTWLSGHRTGQVRPSEELCIAFVLSLCSCFNAPSSYPLPFMQEPNNTCTQHTSSPFIL